MKKLSTLLVSLSMLLLSACGGGSDSSKAAVVVMFGDSLTNDRGQWVTPDQLWVEKLKAQVEADKVAAVAAKEEAKRKAAEEKERLRLEKVEAREAVLEAGGDSAFFSELISYTLTRKS